jgi:16S rRNA (guanine527-N7)-methyltransferase
MRNTPVSGDRDRDEALRLVPVSRETEARFDALVTEVLRWQTVLNLVGPKTLATIWTRHVADSAQLFGLVPAFAQALTSTQVPALGSVQGVKRWIDLGSGAGFPGLVIAAMAADDPAAEIHLVESHARKAAFLRETARRLSLPVIVHADRIEKIVPGLQQSFDVVSARALASLPQLLDFSSELLKKGAIGLFPKGRDVQAELTDASRSWSVDVRAIPSVVDSASCVLLVRSATPRQAS